MLLSIVIPAYNEGNIIKKNLELINKYFTDKFSFEIIVINDGSNDDTNSILYQLKINNLSIYNNLKNRGKGASIRKGIKKSIGKIVLVADADLSAPINQFEKLYDELNNGYEWAQHEPVAREAGVRNEVIDSILSGKGPMGLPAKEGIFIQSAKELVKTGTVTSRTYQALDHLLGTPLTIDFVVTVGYYTMLSRLIHSLDVDFDEGLDLNDQFGR